MRSGKGSTQTFQCKNLQLTKSSCQTSDVFQQWLFLRKKFSLESKVWSFYLFENLPLSVKLSRVLLLPFTLSQRLQIFWELKCAVLKIISAPAKIDAFSDKVQAKSRFFRPHFHKDCKKLLHVPSLWSLRIWCKSIKLPSPASFFLQRIFWKLKCAVLKIVLAHTKIDAFPDRVQAKSILTATVHIQTHVFA